MYPKTANRVHVFWGISGKTMGEGHRNKNIKKTAFWRCQCFAPVVSVVACLISSWGLNQPHHSANAALPSEGGGIAKRIKTARLRRKTNFQKSDYPKTQIKRYPNPFCLTDAMVYVSHNRRVHHNVGTCLRHVSNALIHCCLQRNMPKACPYAMAFCEIDIIF